MFSFLAAYSGEWLLVSDEMVEVTVFWLFLYVVYNVGSPALAGMFDSNADAIRATELEKIKIAK